MAKCVRPAPEADRPARRLLQVQNRLKPGAIVELVAAYQNGTSLRDLEIRFQIARTTVMAHLRRAGVPKRRPVLTPDGLTALLSSTAKGGLWPDLN